LSEELPVSKVWIAGISPERTGEIDHDAKTIRFGVLQSEYQLLPKLVIAWEGSIGTVQVGGKSQKNGVTANDFSSGTPLVYKFLRQDKDKTFVEYSVEVIKY
jgi:hypothetical protein